MLTLIGNRSEWVLAMVACFRLGLSSLPCTEQLRPKDLALRLRVARPRLAVCDERNAGVLSAAGLGRPRCGSRGRAARCSRTAASPTSSPPTRA